jgi:hypothetical protein
MDIPPFPGTDNVQLSQRPSDTSFAQGTNGDGGNKLEPMDTDNSNQGTNGAVGTNIFTFL